MIDFVTMGGEWHTIQEENNYEEERPTIAILDNIYHLLSFLSPNKKSNK